MTCPAPTPIDDSGELSLKVEGYLIELGVLGAVPMSLPPHIARWVAKELLMHAADVDRKAAKWTITVNETKHTVTTPPDPTPNSTNASHIAVKISTHPDNYTPGMRALAAAYESQRERIADLEEDVERLRPREAFVPERIFTYGSEGRDLEFFTECQGGLTIYSSDPHGCGPDFTLSQDIATQLATALLKWSGVEAGVEWESIDDPPSATLVGAEFLFADGSRVVTSAARDTTHWWDDCKRAGWSHWSPLPKPPVVKS